MYSRLLLIAFLFLALSATAKPKHPLFQITEQDLGTITKGVEQITIVFELKNTTDKTITISAVHASCGCMDVNYPQYPIKKQGTGKIKVTIDVNRQHGYFSKSLLVYATNVRPTILKIKGIIP